MTHGPWHELRLEVRIDEEDGAETPQLIPRVDGSVLFLDLDTRANRDTSGLGMDPDHLLGRHSPLLPLGLGSGPDDEQPRATVWRCSCGEPGCSSIGVRVRRELDSRTGYDAVVWEGWRIQYGFARRLGFVTLPPLRFDTPAYYAELIRADTDRWWESTPRRAARELASLLDARPELLGRRGLALISTAGYLHQGQGHIHVWLRDHQGRHCLTLPCEPTADPEAEAQRWAERLASADPATLPGHRYSNVP